MIKSGSAGQTQGGAMVAAGVVAFGMLTSGNGCGACDAGAVRRGGD